jgi:hypothetical protein
MRKLHVISFFVLALTFSGCLKDHSIKTFTYYLPVYKTPAEVRAEIRSNDPLPLSQPGKLFYKDGYVFLNELFKGIHIIDVKNPAQPRSVAFVKIPGNLDMAVRENILYADLYTDLVAIDISDPLNVKLKTTISGVFPNNYLVGFADSAKIITEWRRVDTTIREEDYGSWMAKADRVTTSPTLMNSSGGGPAKNGKGGSMARFGLMLDRLYTVSYSELKVFNTSIAENPSYVKSFQFSNGVVETIFPYGNYLFIGSMTGMYLFDVSDKDNPVQKGVFEHARVCDPVIADGDFAYVTLRNGNQCQGFVNQLDVVNIKNIENPSLVKSFPMTNPHGLSKDGSTLLICEGTEGLRVLDASFPEDIKTIAQLKGFTTYDVITLGGYALVSANDGLYVVDYTNPAKPVISSSIKIVKE